MTAEEMVERMVPVATFMPMVLPIDWRPARHPEPRWVAFYMHARAPLKVMLSARREVDEKIWLHLSMSHEKRLPSWEELRDAKDLFLGRERLAVQVLPPASQYVNLAKTCLHLWSCLDGDPTPDFRVEGMI